jgi:uncharacterized membrane protein YraQ (UPF0718 family)
LEAVAAKLLAGAGTTLALFWDSLFGLIFGFLISAIVQVAFSRATMHRLLGPNLRGLANGTVFGIVASACSYGAAAAARGFFQKGADLRAVFAFMIASTNMNLAIVVMFWAMLGWKFAFAEFAGGIVIITVVALGMSALFSPEELRGLAAAMPRKPRAVCVSECLQCGMAGEAEHAVEYEGSTYLFCGARHEREFREHPARVLGEAEVEAETVAGSESIVSATQPRGLAALRLRATWREVLEVALGDVRMLRGEIVIGFVVAGFAAALVPAEWLSGALRSVGSVPVIGYPLLLLTGLLIAIATFVCSMGNVPIARYLASAGIPLGANTTFIYGDLLIPPLIAIYRKSFPPKAVWSFLGLFVLGACIAGALMDFLIGNLFGGQASVPMAMDVSDRFTLIANALGIVSALAVVIAARNAPPPVLEPPAPAGRQAPADDGVTTIDLISLK